MHFIKKGREFGIQFDNEWVHSTEKGLDFFDKEEITEVSSGPFLAQDVSYVDSEKRKMVSFTNEFSKKFEIDLGRNREQEHSKSDDSIDF